jgi:hypothetical protein
MESKSSIAIPTLIFFGLGLVFSTINLFPNNIFERNIQKTLQRKLSTVEIIENTLVYKEAITEIDFEFDLSILKTVKIITTDEGPFLDDLFWVLKNDYDDISIPSESIGIEFLVNWLQTLDNFNNEAVIQAHQSVDNKEFLCWG